VKTEVTYDQLLVGIGVSPGIAIGRALLLHRPTDITPVREIAPEEVVGEIQRLHEAITLSRQQLLVVRHKAEEHPTPEPGLIIDAHLLILDDIMLVSETITTIEKDLVDAETALRRTLLRIRHLFAAIEDEYLRERRSDVEFVGQRILRNLIGYHEHPLQGLTEQVILVAHDLSPADTLQLDRNKILAFVTDAGGRTSHTAILARSMGIPAIVGLESVTQLVQQGLPLIVDGSTGMLVIHPSAASFRNYLQRKQQYEYAEQELELLRDLPAQTVDGYELILRANLDTPADIPQARKNGANGVGLMRTEFLFMNRTTPPTEEEQFRIYKEMVEGLAPASVMIRTLDVGGDKLVDHINLEGEANPALGLRAIRFSLKEQVLFRTQLRAILRASAFGQVRLAFPMITGIEELRACRLHLRAAMEELTACQQSFDPALQVGLVVETPAAALLAGLIAREVDFFSVGTNDLIQYCLAVDRGNEHLAYLYDPLHPAILRALQLVCDAGRSAGIPVGMCGEMASDPLSIDVLVALGFTELSMSPNDILRMKRALRLSRKDRSDALMATLLTLPTGAEVRHHLEEVMQTAFPALFPPPEI
jgi:phosphotransferase system enzyme I (PtsI)